MKKKISEKTLQEYKELKEQKEDLTFRCHITGGFDYTDHYKALQEELKRTELKIAEMEKKYKGLLSLGVSE